VKTRKSRITIIVIITVISVLSSLLITYVIAEVFGSGVDAINIASAIFSPALIAPIVMWYIVGLMVKIKDLEQEQRTLATYDTLTGLLSRRAFMEQAEYLFKETDDDPHIAIAYLDIDNFKQINEAYGHAGGDEVLSTFGALIKKQIRKHDVAGRLGGEEFAIILTDATQKIAFQVLERIQKSIRAETIKYETNEIKYTVSIGLSLFDKSRVLKWEELIVQADHALYQAKHSGKDCIVLFNTQSTAVEQHSSGDDISIES
jgi:diguanylate cyclase (GGDEF)-like protein